MNKIEKYLQLKKYLDENNIYFIKNSNDKIVFYNINSFFPIHLVYLAPDQNIVDYLEKDLELKHITDSINDIENFTEWYKIEYQKKPTNISLKIGLPENDDDYSSTAFDDSKLFKISIAHNGKEINNELSCRIKLSKNSNLENINQVFPSLLFTCSILKDSPKLFEYLFHQKIKNVELMNQIINKSFNTIYSKDNEIKKHFIIEDGYEFNYKNN